MSEKKHTVFISYRRDGGFETAKYLFDSLVRDGYSVTFDIDSLRNGRFDEALVSRIDECIDFIIILSKGCFDRTTDPNFPRENDWMRRELAQALKAKKNIIPIMLRGFNGFPDNLPDDIREVRLMNGPKYEQEYIDAFFEKLKKFLKSARQGTQMKKIESFAFATAKLTTAHLLLAFVFKWLRYPGSWLTNILDLTAADGIWYLILVLNSVLWGSCFAILVSWFKRRRNLESDISCQEIAHISVNDVTSELPLSQPNAATSQKIPWKSGDDFESYINGRKQTHEDALYFLRSFAATAWTQLNAVAVSGRAFSAELAKISEGEDQKIVSLRVRQGLTGVNLGNFDDIVAGITGCAAECMGFGSCQEDYFEFFPNLKHLVKDSGPSEADAVIFKRELAARLSLLRQEYTIISEHYKCLCEGYERYDKIKSANGWWKDLLLGGALGYLTGGVGVVAGVLWDNWMGKNDKDFVETYINAIQDFISSCDAFTSHGQQIVNECVIERQSSWNRKFADEEILLRALNAEGEDLDQVEKLFNEKGKKEFGEAFDSESSMLFALAIESLKQDAPISPDRIDKLVQSFRDLGLPLAVDGSLDDSAVGALSLQNPSTQDLPQRFLEIVRPCQQYDSFYILENIPKKKLINALRGYGFGASLDDVLCLFDATFFGGGDTGFFITADGVWWNYSGEKPHSCCWGDVKIICAQKSDGNKIRVNKWDVTVPNSAATKFATMFNGLKSLFAKGV